MKAKALRETHHRFTFPVFSGFVIDIIVTNDIPASRAKRDNVVGRTRKALEHCDAICDSGRDGWAYLYYKETIDTGTLAHEAWHAIWTMFSFFGMEFENENVAYHLGYIVDQAVKTYNKHRRTKNERTGTKRKKSNGRGTRRRRSTTNN